MAENLRYVTVLSGLITEVKRLQAEAEKSKIGANGDAEVKMLKEGQEELLKEAFAIIGARIILEVKWKSESAAKHFGERSVSKKKKRKLNNVSVKQEDKCVGFTGSVENETQSAPKTSKMAQALNKQAKANDLSATGNNLSDRTPLSDMVSAKNLSNFFRNRPEPENEVTKDLDKSLSGIPRVRVGGDIESVSQIAKECNHVQWESIKKDASNNFYFVFSREVNYEGEAWELFETLWRAYAGTHRHLYLETWSMKPTYLRASYS